VSVARRSLATSQSQAKWETLTLTDYKQTEDDGHDIISLGICHNDGTLHIAFDQHDNDFHYRVSTRGIATNPASVQWGPGIFGGIQVRNDDAV